MKSHVTIVGVLFISLGAFITAFLLFVLLLGTLNSLGLTHGKPDQTVTSAFLVLVLLAYPTLWIIQTGLALYYHRRSGRLWGIVLGGILLIGLNTALLLTKDQPTKTGQGLVAFHVLLILIGLYSLVVLVPGRVKNYLQ